MTRLAWLLATSPDASLRDGTRAIELAWRAAQLTGGRDVKVLDTLAAAFAEAGRFPEALAAARRALEMATRRNLPEVAQELRRRLTLYEAQRPFHERQANESRGAGKGKESASAG
jgi:hypothetical protein